MRRIGLLGGSFNPAHSGHRQVSLEVMHAYGLQEVWWLVSPGNPLKNPTDMADYALRIDSCRALVRHPQLRVSDMEAQLRTRYTFDTVTALQRRYPQFHFVWIMGADNLVQFHQWKRWRELANRVEILVVDRKPYTHRAARSRAAIALAARRHSPLPLRQSRNALTPCWRYHFGRISL
ncbi:MAG: nicotinate (nicotinamide) nucleotide adenylyltransferase, partial [Rickettsiales bacterium]|nr:nicotinate (nicotinamide) nucleotide adenylyltransferase [Rickettsiales bacterium]